MLLNIEGLCSKMYPFAAQDYRKFLFLHVLVHLVLKLAVFAAQDYGEFVGAVFDTFCRTKTFANLFPQCLSKVRGFTTNLTLNECQQWLRSTHCLLTPSKLP